MYLQKSYILWPTALFLTHVKNLASKFVSFCFIFWHLSLSIDGFFKIPNTFKTSNNGHSFVKRNKRSLRQRFTGGIHARGLNNATNQVIPSNGLVNNRSNLLMSSSLTTPLLTPHSFGHPVASTHGIKRRFLIPQHLRQHHHRHQPNQTIILHRTPLPHHPPFASPPHHPPHHYPSHLIRSAPHHSLHSFGPPHSSHLNYLHHHKEEFRTRSSGGLFSSCWILWKERRTRHEPILFHLLVWRRETEWSESEAREEDDFC